MAAGKGINKKCVCSDELAEFLGKDSISRPELMKAVWKYIKAERLNEGRIIYPKDSELEPVLGSKPIDMFKMASILSEHLD